MKTLLILLTLVGFSFSTWAQNPPNEYNAVYKQGSGPFAKGTKVRISKRDDGYQFFPMVDQAYTIRFSSLRGAVATDSGLWVYWFDGSENTLSSFYDTKDRQYVLADEMNAAIKDFNSKSAPMSSTQSEEYRQRYEAYKEEALKQSR